MGRLSFRTKLQLVLVSFALVLIGSALFAVRHATVTAVRDKIEHDFEQTRTILAQQTKAQIAALEDALATALGDPLFRSQLGEASARADETGLEEEAPPERSSIKEAHEVFSSADLPLMNRYPGFAVLNVDGQRVFSKAAPTRFGDNMSRTPIVAAVKERGRALQLFEPKGGAHGNGLVADGEQTSAYLLLARAVQSGARTLGYVVIAEGLTEFMAQLERSSGAHVGFSVEGGGVVASNGASTAIVRELAAIAGLTADKVVSVDLGGEPHLVLATTLVDADGAALGRAFFARSYRAEVGRLLGRLDLALLLALALSLAASVPIAAFLARRMTVPLKSLEQAARQLESGDFSAHASVTSEDELGRVGRAFNAMMVALRERNIDRLTGAYNRRHLIDALEAQILRSDTLGAPVSLMLLDLDHFRALNEKYGRAAGDAVLKAVTRLCHDSCKPGDVLARYADDELVILLQDQDGQAAETRAKALQVQIAAREIAVGKERIKCTITASVVERDPRWPSAHDLLRALDRALYAAKTGDRNRVVKAA